jgi:hypothetical protein
MVEAPVGGGATRCRPDFRAPDLVSFGLDLRSTWPGGLWGGGRRLEVV